MLKQTLFPDTNGQGSESHFQGPTSSRQRCPFHFTDDLQHRSQALLTLALADNTKKLYTASIHMFNAFRTSYNHQIISPPTPYQITQFIAYLAIHKFSSSAVKSYLAGISFYCKISNVSDTTQSFIVKKTLLGYCHSKVRTDNRKPITLDILRKIIIALPSVCTSHYEASLFSAIFTTTFFGYFGIEELVQNSSREVGHAIQTSGVRYNTSNNTIQISLKHSKNRSGREGITHKLATHK